MVSIFSSSSNEDSYTRPSHATLASFALQITFWIIVCVTDGQTDTPFLAGLAASTEERLPIFALSAFDVGKIVIVQQRQLGPPTEGHQPHRDPTHRTKSLSSRAGF